MICTKKGTYEGEKTALVLRNDIYQSNLLVDSRKFFDLLGTKIFLLGLRGLNPRFSEQDKYYGAVRQHKISGRAETGLQEALRHDY